MPSALVIDDSMLIRHAVCRYLEDEGLQVESATNGAEALEMLQNLRPDLIITDLQMPKMDGYQLIRKLRSEPLTCNIPIVILAAAKNNTETPVVPEANFVIFKDIAIEIQLREVLNKVLEPSRRPPETSSQS
jgi:CheY-like chemotaxis protein